MAKKELNILFPNKYRIVSCDFSMRRPGIAVIGINNKQITSISYGNLNNKTTKKTHGQMLRLIYNWLTEYCTKELSNVPTFYIREHAFNSRASMREIAIFLVVGVSTLWLNDNTNQSDWIEIYPVTIKKAITGDSKATKDQVAASLDRYVGIHQYECDDESDALAAATAWLLINKQLEVE